jgi:hypothetical protein
MAENNTDFTTKEMMTYLFLRRIFNNKIYDMLFSTGDDERSGSPTQVTIPENVYVIHSMILDD